MPNLQQFFAMLCDLGVNKIITVDTKDFTMYRRFRDQRLPLIHPDPA